jgi:hypothetical protein
MERWNIGILGTQRRILVFHIIPSPQYPIIPGLIMS